ncbi:hypothetical protein [Escherichia coli]|uniref:hypothetical protein n=1 Tax=Escherichia coli TaxID=562 RepID=UPI0038B230BE
MASPLFIAAAGMCCSIGYSVPSASAAIRSGLDHFAETTFYDLNGKPLIGAQLYKNDTWGDERLLWMFENVVAECILKTPGMTKENTCLIFLLSECAEQCYGSLGNEFLFSRVKTTWHESSICIHGGKTGIGSAITEAQRILYSGLASYALLVGVDSYFSPARINHLLTHERVLCTSNRDGFIPGEGAGAIVFCKPDSCIQGIYITGVGVSNEDAHILQNDKANMARGLSVAIRKAIHDAGILLAETDFHISGVTGESWYFRETALAITRCLEKKKKQYPHYQLASNLGETGAASGPLTLAYLNEMMCRFPDTGERALVHFSGDSGLRVALVAEYYRG